MQKHGKYSRNLTGLWGGVKPAERERERTILFSQPECQSVQYEGVRAVRAVCSIQSAGPLGAVS